MAEQPQPSGSPQPAPNGAPQPAPYGAPHYGTPQYGTTHYGAPQPPTSAAPGQPPYGTPPAYPPYGTPLKAPGTNGFAIAALVLGLLGGILLSVIFSIVALRQIRRTGQGGKGLAIAGLVLSGLWAIGVAAVIAVAVTTSAQRGTSGAITQPGRLSVADIRVGDCLVDWQTGTATSFTVTACTNPHQGEVYFETTLAERDGAYPGDEAIDEQAETLCNAAVDSALDVDRAPEDADIVYLRPLARGWAAGDRKVSCLVRTSSAVTESLRKGA